MAIDVEALYRKYGPMVMRRCRQLLKNEQKALDAMQDTFVKLLHYKDRLDASAPSSLLYRVATNICLNILRTESKRPTTGKEEILMQIASSDNPEEKVVAQDLIENIFKAEKVTTKEMAVFYYIDGMTLEQVAAEIGLSVSGVRKRLASFKARINAQKEVLT